MKIIDKFEKEFNVLCRTITVSDFEKISQDEKFKDFTEDFNEFYNLLKSISEVTADKVLSFELNVICAMITFDKTEADLLDIFKQYREMNIERDELIDQIKKMADSDNLITSLSAYLCQMVSLMDVEFDHDKLKFKINNEFKKVYEDLSGQLIFSYILIDKLLDLVYGVREEYFKNFEEDLFEPEFDKWLTGKLVELHSFEDEVLYKNKDIPDAGIKPEELRLIDITKFKKGEE